MADNSSDNINPRTTASKLKNLQGIKKEIHQDQAQIAKEKQNAKGKKSARERLAALLDEGTFQEIDELVKHQFLGKFLHLKELLIFLEHFSYP